MFLFRNRIVVDGIRIEGADARRLIQNAMRDTNAGGQTGSGMTELLCVFAFVALMVPGFLFIQWVSQRWPTFPSTLVPFAVGVGVSTLMGSWWRWTHERELRRAMKSAGYELCEHYGYWLRGLSDNVTQCPECGAKRKTAG